MALYTQRRRRTRSRSAWIGGPFVAAPTDVSAENGLATAAGGTVTLMFTVTAATGVATASGGTANVAEGVTAVTGVATAGGGAATLAVTLTAAGGTATASGGVATAFEVRSSFLPGKSRMRAARGLGIGRTPQAYPRRDTRRYWIGTALNAPLNLSAENGVATASGGTADVAEGITAAAGVATADGGAVALAITLIASTGLAQASGGTVLTGAVTTSLVPARQVKAAAGLGIGHRRWMVRRKSLRRGWLGGPTPVLATVDLVASGSEVIAPPPIGGQGAQAIADGGTVTFSSEGEDLNLSATNGTATASGGTVSLTVSLTATSGTATATGTTPIVSFSWAAATGVATASGGSATATGGGLAAADGLATAAGGTATLSFALTVATGAASAQGGTATASSTTGIVAQEGVAIAGGGTSLFRPTYLVAAGAATAGGGDVSRIVTAITGVATASGGMVTPTLVLIAAAGTASGGGGSATAFVPTLGLIDGSGFISTGVDDNTTAATIVDGSSVLTGVG